MPQLDRSNGPIPTAEIVRSLAQALADAKPRSQRSRDICKLALCSPEAFLARPDWQKDLIDAAIFSAVIEPNLGKPRFPRADYETEAHHWPHV